MTRTAILALLFVLLTVTSVLAEGPREVIAFDSDWRFLLGDPAGAQAADFDDAAWRTLDLPHDWSIEGAIDRDAPETRGGQGRSAGR